MVVGIIGGGQLGMYLAQAAYNMGYDTVVYDENDNCCAKDIASKFIQGKFNDPLKLEEFCRLCDVITYEFENVDNELVEKLTHKYNIVQGATPLILGSHRLNERKLGDELEIKQPNWRYITNSDEAKNNDLTMPYIMKTDTLGYDGKGQYHINEEADLKNVDFNDVVYMAEEKITFDYEISVIGIRSVNDEFITYDPFYNIHHKGILNITLIEQDVPDKVKKTAQDAVRKIMFEKDIYGILCCEFFIKDDEVYFNEMAPRPHNSGHITMDTHYVSQYENHLRAIIGLPLGTTKIKGNAFMVNVLGQDVEKTEELLKKDYQNIKYYSYHKEARENRKVGHLIVFDLTKVEEFINNWK